MRILSVVGLVVAALVASTAAAVPATATAGEVRQQLGAFGPDGTETTEFGAPGPLAVDQGTHEVYVADFETGSIKRFDENGQPSNFSALGSNELGGLALFPEAALVQIAVNSANHNFYVVDYGNFVIKAFQSNGEPADFTAGPGAGTNELSFGEPCGVAVDQDGNIYVGDYASAAVYVIRPTGEEVTSFSAEEVCNVAVDSGGAVYTAQFVFNGGTVERHNPSSFPVTATTTYSAGTVVDPGPAFALATDPVSNDLYVDHGAEVAQYDSGGSRILSVPTDGDLVASEGVAVDGSSDHLYVSEREGERRVRIFGPPVPLPTAVTEDASNVLTSTATLHGTVDSGSGPSVTGCEFQYIPETSFRASETQALTVKATGGQFTLSFEGQTTRPIAFNAPIQVVREELIGIGAFANVSGGPGSETGTTPYTIAFSGPLAYKDVETLAADGGGLTGGSPSSGATIETVRNGRPSSFETATSVPCEPASSVLGQQSVSADISGLAPNTPYAFRLVATSDVGTETGPARVFITATGPPTVIDQRIESVGVSEATVSAKVNPGGAKTTYHVEYGTTSTGGKSTPESAPIGSEGDNSNHKASVHIGGLLPDTTYHFHFVATNPIDQNEGIDSTFTTSVATSLPPPCANDSFRAGFGAALPDCRAYEQATPVDKGGSNVQAGIGLTQASNNGDRFTFQLAGGLASSGGSSIPSAFISSREDSGWTDDGLLPATEAGQSALVLGWSDSLGTSVANAPGPSGNGTSVYTRSANDGSSSLAIAGPSSLREMFIAGFAADESHFIFETPAPLVAGAVSTEYNVYDFDHGVVTLAGRIPIGNAVSCTGLGCIPAPGGSAAGSKGQRFSSYTQNTLSRDGSKIFFTALGGSAPGGRLYVRENGSQTTWVSASQRALPDPNGEKPATFRAATPTGSKVFFSSCEKLTDDSTAASTVSSCTGQDLYSYNTNSGELSDLTVDSNLDDSGGAEVQGVLGTSDDGSYVYFVANGVLAAGASAGSCGGGGGAGTCNLYVWHNGTTSFIAELSGSAASQDPNNWALGFPGSQATFQRTSRVSSNGDTLLFSSIRSLTDYESDGAREFYRYSASSQRLVCVSCNPTGIPPVGDASLGSEIATKVRFTRAMLLTRNLSTDGSRAFFESPDALLPSDTNGVKDVYEWEADGSGSCKSTSQNGGCLYLLSSGTSPNPSQFLDASADGDNAFLLTSQQLVPSDHDQIIDVYDARVEGGLSGQHPLNEATCNGADCQVNPPPPSAQGLASAAFSGPGSVNQRPKSRKCPKGKKKKSHAGKTRCVKTSKKQKHHKRHSNGRGSK